MDRLNSKMIKVRRAVDGLNNASGSLELDEGKKGFLTLPVAISINRLKAQNPWVGVVSALG